MKGIVKWYNIKQGYGLIQGEDGVDVFIHKSQVPFWTIFLNSGDRVEYTKEETKKGLSEKDIRVL